MRKTSFFKAEDLAPPETKADRFERIKKSLKESLDVDPDKAEEIASKAAAAEKKSRYAPLKQGTRAIARLKFDQVERLDPETGKKHFVHDVREKNGARWIDAKFILEGRYNNRWIKMRFMLKGNGYQTNKLMAETKRNVAKIKDCHDIPADARLSALDGLRVPVVLGVCPRHGDNKPVNYIDAILCPNPRDAHYAEYEAFAKTRKVKLLPDEGGNMRRWIDFPGWNLYPFTPLFMTLKERIDTYHDRVKASAERALKKMENA